MKYEWLITSLWSWPQLCPLTVQKRREDTQLVVTHLYLLKKLSHAKPYFTWGFSLSVCHGGLQSERDWKEEEIGGIWETLREAAQGAVVVGFCGRSSGLQINNTSVSSIAHRKWQRREEVHEVDHCHVGGKKRKTQKRSKHRKEQQS